MSGLLVFILGLVLGLALSPWFFLLCVAVILVSAWPAT